jgi:hypothetical protein
MPLPRQFQLVARYLHSDRFPPSTRRAEDPPETHGPHRRAAIRAESSIAAKR